MNKEVIFVEVIWIRVLGLPDNLLWYGQLGELSENILNVYDQSNLPIGEIYKVCYDRDNITECKRFRVINPIAPYATSFEIVGES